MFKKRKVFLFWEFYKSTLLINLSLSILIYLLTFDLVSFFNSFIFIGLFGNILFKENYRKNEYFFYYNNNFSKIELFVCCLILNIILSIVLKIVLWVITLYLLTV